MYSVVLYPFIMRINNVFIGTAVMSVIILSISVVLLFRKNVSSFNKTNYSDGCTPYNVFIEKGSANFTAVVSWRTTEDCLGFVQYGREAGDLQNVALDISNDKSGRFHTSTLDGLVSTQKYYFLINSDSTGYGNDGLPLEFILMDL